MILEQRSELPGGAWKLFLEVWVSIRRKESTRLRSDPESHPAFDFTKQNEGDHGYTACLPTPRSWCPRALRVLPRAVQGHAVYSFRHLLSVCRLPRFLLTKQVPVEQRLTTGDSARSTPSMEQSNSLSFRAQLMAGWPTSPPCCIWLQRACRKASRC